jgi:hypothetical protein
MRSLDPCKKEDNYLRTSSTWALFPDPPMGAGENGIEPARGYALMI